MRDVVTYTHLDATLKHFSYMDPITCRHLSQKEVDYISDRIWENVKHISHSLEAKDDDFDNDLFYTPPNSPFKPISIELEKCLVVDRCKRHSSILLDKHLQICDQVLYPQLGWSRHPPQLTLKSMEKNQVRLS
jgi:hypothetical protein